MIKGEKDNIGLAEVCEILNKSKRTVSRYIRQGLLNPERIKSRRGTLEYRFNRTDLAKFKKPERTEQTRPDDEIITLLKDQLKVKDEQINQLIERSRETNILLNRLQNQLLLTEGKTINEWKGKKDKYRKDRGVKEDKKGQGINGFFRRLFKG
jgi:transcriptional regulator with XRE-family HTH domain